MAHPVDDAGSQKSSAAQLRAHIKGISPKKRFGQNFLIWPDVLDKIVAAGGLTADTNVLEIGPGPGSLTLWLLKQPIKSLHALELDASLAPVLEAFNDPRLTLHFGDALKSPFWTLCPPPCVVLSNLPYNVASPLLVRMLENRQYFQRLVLMFQKEVADRILAQPGTKAYGRLGVLTQLLAVVEKVMDVPPSAFKPQPKVMSTILKITPYPAPLYPVDVQKLMTLLHHVFQKRRKMLRAGLKGLIADPEAALGLGGIDPTRRPETLTLTEFAALSHLVP